MSARTEPFTATRNACKLCTPLGAALVFRGVEGTMPLLHGSQGCATYIRRYFIGHFREPMDIASSSFSEESAIFGGKANLHAALLNVIKQYDPKVIGVATTCLAETIGDDMKMLLGQFRREHAETPLPEIVHVSTPSYSGTHMDGFHAAVRAVVSQLCPAEGSVAAGEGRMINVFTGMVSTADLRHLRELVESFEREAAILPDYSDSLDSGIAARYDPIPAGGTPLAQIRRMGRACGSLTLGATIPAAKTAGAWLAQMHGVPERRLGLPIGIAETDRLVRELETLSGRTLSTAHHRERSRLIDSYVDGHKLCFGRRAILYGEEDLVIGLATFLAEIGVVPCLVASGGKSGRLAAALEERIPQCMPEITVVEGVDFVEIGERAEVLKPHLLVGNSKGYKLARSLNVPLVRVGFPIHDRLGGQRILHLGYRGAQQLFDRIVNTLLEREQDESPVGYGSY